MRNGLWQGPAAEDAATRVPRQPRFSVGLDLKAGPGAGEVYTCDLSLDYVKVNADYRSSLQQPRKRPSVVDLQQ